MTECKNGMTYRKIGMAGSPFGMAKTHALFGRSEKIKLPQGDGRKGLSTIKKHKGA